MSKPLRSYFSRENGTWTTGTSFNVAPDEKFIVYAKITDNAGNVTIINSNGVVVGNVAGLDSIKITFGDGDSADNVTKTLYLPKISENGSVITWSSSNTNVITDSGRISGTEPELEDIPVILTATIKDPKTNEVITK